MIEDGILAMRAFLAIKALERLTTRAGVIEAMIETPALAQIRPFKP
jgi:hypothetical protein